MTTHKHDKYLKGFTTSAIVAVVLITVLTIAGELYKPLKDALKDAFMHHWIGKGVVSFVGFIVLGFILQAMHTALPSKEKLAKCLTSITAFCAVAIIAFFFYEFYWAH